MKKALAILAILILSLAITSTVRAQTPTPTLTIYTAQDPEDQDPDISGIENYVFWTPFQVETMYYFISHYGDDSFSIDVEDALSAWRNAFPSSTNWYWLTQISSIRCTSVMSLVLLARRQRDA